MRRHGLLALSMFMLTLGLVSFYQSSNPSFISSADAVGEINTNISAILLVAGIFFILLSVFILYIRYVKNK